ncbi:GlsB/YeaQ/YmgE family stress response membrane protein [Pseudonocardia phyllosphaerae]|uniref:GlsB/YeaQ/YmgE family stress response membrane protein n=1 Tax=Pseudonocardia phyllosphaerae TaxID=3390502 RepID=UPI00397C6618
MLWTIIIAIVVGLIAGFLARAIVPGKDNIGIIPTIILGIVGSLVGGVIWSLISGGGFNAQQFMKFSPGGIIGSVIGAIIVLVIYNAVTGRKKVGR